MRRFLLVEDHPLVADAEAARIREIAKGSEVTTTGNVANAVSLLRQEDNRYDIVFLDLALPGTSGIGAFREIARHVDASRIVVLSGEDDQSRIDAVRRAGGRAFLSKALSQERMDAAIATVVAGGTFFPAALAQQAFGKLLQSEIEVLACLADGTRIRTNKDIAASLRITVRTCDRLLYRAFRKLNARSRVEAVVKARAAGLIGDG